MSWQLQLVCTQTNFTPDWNKWTEGAERKLSKLDLLKHFIMPYKAVGLKADAKKEILKITPP